MQPGAKRLPPSEKARRGTNKKQDENFYEVKVDNNVLVMPEYMKLDAEARAVWNEFLPRATAVGINYVDSELYARYCVHIARIRPHLANGGMLDAKMLTVLRQYEELLRMAGPKSRVGVRSLDARKNPFGNNGKRG